MVDRVVLTFPAVLLLSSACWRGEWQETSRQDAGRSRTAKLVIRTTPRPPPANIAARLHCGLNPDAGPNRVPAMAQAACFSARQFHRLTLRMTGETPAAHQRRLRLDRAAWRLLSSRTTILEIALQGDWASHEAFTRAFRTRFGLTPSAFRKTNGSTLPRSLRAALSIATCATYAKEKI
jgi:AraC-like DNA-binding protein